MKPIEARRLAEKSFKHAEHPLRRQPTNEAEVDTVRAKTARLRASDWRGRGAEFQPIGGRASGIATESEMMPAADVGK